MKWGQRRSGYSLVELMVVVTIVGASVLAFAPGFSRAMADRRLNTAARELVRIGRRARAESMSYLRAYLLWIQPQGGTNTAPRFRLIRGLSNGCLVQDWNTLEATCDVTPHGTPCIEDVDLGADPSFSTSALQIGMAEELLDGSFGPAGNSNRGFCYAPNGTLWLTGASGNAQPGAGSTVFSADNTVNGGIVYHVALTRAGAFVQPERLVLFPLGGSPRVMR